ncbi:MAG: Fic family protein, partial [Chitinophagaceae bacterium]|nr:Fic family protein [Chitinophagaceae bacterium]
RNTLSNHADEGRIRLDNEVNVVDVSNGEVIHIPPDVGSLPVLLPQLFDFFNDDAGGIFIHPVVKACIIHFMIGYIHPFVDGNGRTARALFYWFLIKKGYWLTEFLSISKIILRSKGQYARAFQYTEIDQNDMTYFIAYNLHAMKLSFIELRRYIERKNEQKKRITRFFGEDDLSYRQSIILDWFINEPALVLTVKEAENRLGVSNLSARLDINNLLDKGYLKKVNLNKVLTGFVKGEKLLLTERKHRVTSTRLDANQAELF